jgi:hypothetical protein
VIIGWKKLNTHTQKFGIAVTIGWKKIKHTHTQIWYSGDYSVEKIKNKHEFGIAVTIGWKKLNTHTHTQKYIYARQRRANGVEVARVLNGRRHVV